jgi:hypothetical protein
MGAVVWWDKAFISLIQGAFRPTSEINCNRNQTYTELSTRRKREGRAEEIRGKSRLFTLLSIFSLSLSLWKLKVRILMQDVIQAFLQHLFYVNVGESVERMERVRGKGIFYSINANSCQVSLVGKLFKSWICVRLVFQRDS